MSLRLAVISDVATVTKCVVILHFFVSMVEITRQSFLGSHFYHGI